MNLDNINKFMHRMIITENKNDYQIYHNSYSSAIQTALQFAEGRGYSFNDEEVGRRIGTGPIKPKSGQTNRISLTLYKDGKESTKGFHIQVYNMGTENNPYELNCYVF